MGFQLSCWSKHLRKCWMETMAFDTDLIYCNNFNHPQNHLSKLFKGQNFDLSSGATLRPDFRILRPTKCKSIVKSPLSLWTTISKPQVWHFGLCHLGFLEPEISMFALEGGAKENTFCRTFYPDCSDSQGMHKHDLDYQISIPYDSHYFNGIIKI